MKQDRTNEVLSDSSVTRYASYASLSDDDLRRLERAYDEEDYQEQHRILKRNMIHNDSTSVGRLMDVYPDLVERLTKKVLKSNYDRLSPDGKRIAKRGDLNASIPMRREYIREKVIQRQSSGTEYSRAQPLRYSRPELHLIMLNSNLSNDKLYDLHKQLYGNKHRSKSSIVSQKYRMRKKKGDEHAD